MAQHVCPRCQTVNAVQAPYCVECGHALYDQGDTRPLTVPGANLTRRSQQPLSYTVTFIVGDDHLSVLMKQAERLIMGRQSGQAPNRPDLDLGRFNAAEHGISRIHAVLECNENGIYLMDLGSRNGTFVNNVPLTAFNPHLLRDGDTVALGKLVVTVALQVEEGNAHFTFSAKPRSKTGKLEETIRLMRV
ncbi:MAG: FHA domain-containing protein [Anaerolineae bacterium]